MKSWSLINAMILSLVSKIRRLHSDLLQRSVPILISWMFDRTSLKTRWRDCVHVQVRRFSVLLARPCESAARSRRSEQKSAAVREPINNRELQGIGGREDVKWSEAWWKAHVMARSRRDLLERSWPWISRQDVNLLDFFICVRVTGLGAGSGLWVPSWDCHQRSSPRLMCGNMNNSWAMIITILNTTSMKQHGCCQRLRRHISPACRVRHPFSVSFGTNVSAADGRSWRVRRWWRHVVPAAPQLSPTRSSAGCVYIFKHLRGSWRVSWHPQRVSETTFVTKHNNTWWIFWPAGGPEDHDINVTLS